MKHKKKKKERGSIGFCQREKKAQYRTAEEANKAITIMFGMVNMTLQEYQDLHSYKCDHCKFFHIGHKSYYVMKVNRESGQQVSTGKS